MAREKPLVSIITTTYNRAKLLPRAIKSTLAQSFKDFEHIIIDDVSTDNTEEVVKKFKDKRIKYIKLNYKKKDADKGAAKGRNAGIETAKGKYIAFLDSDDEWLPKKLEKQIDLFEKLDDSYGMVYSGFTLVVDKNEPKANKKKDMLPSIKGRVYSKLLAGNITGLLTAVVRKECLDEVGPFDANLTSCQDWDLWIRITKQYKIEYIPKVLAKAYIHGEQISANYESKLFGRERILEKYKKDISKHKKIHTKHLNIIGVLSAVTNKPKSARDYFKESLKVNPLQKSPYIHVVYSKIAPKRHQKFVEKTIIPKISSVAIGHGVL